MEERDEWPNGWTPEDARSRAYEVLSEGFDPHWVCANVHCNAVETVARYIAAHEQPPIGSDLLLAREIAAAIFEAKGRDITATLYRAGDHDNDPEILAILKLLKERRP